MNEFRSDGSALLRKTVIRVGYESAFLSLIALSLFFDWPVALSMTVKISILSVVIAFILFGIAGYPKAKKISDTLTVRVSDAGLCFLVDDSERLLLWEDLSFLNDERRNGRIEKIRLKTRFGQNINLEGYENMENLANQIHQYLK